MDRQDTHFSWTAVSKAEARFTPEENVPHQRAERRAEGGAEGRDILRKVSWCKHLAGKASRGFEPRFRVQNVGPGPKLIARLFNFLYNLGFVCANVFRKS